MKALLIILVTSSSFCLAKNLQSHMQDIYTHYIKLYEGQLNEKQSEFHFKELEKHILSKKLNDLKESAILAPLREVLIKSYQEINTAHTKKNYQYTKYRVKSLSSTCIACHSHLPAELFPPVKRKLSLKKLSLQDKINFSFLLRDYKKTLSLLEKDILGELKSKRSFRALEDLLNIYSQTFLKYNGPTENLLIKLNAFKKYAVNKNTINSYIQKMKSQLKYTQEININKADEKYINFIINKYLEPNKEHLLNLYSSSKDKLVLKTLTSTLISKYIILNYKSNITPKLLYWMGVIENFNHSLDIYSLGELYYKECIIRFPKSQYAKDAYKALKSSITAGYTGSSGTHIPKAVQKELKFYKSKIK
ncbi:MAG: hypothetical protein N4A33_02700 [Bacteriovoracaceae bacterium]|jgi:hypothetical protein|nr:hypothetical protein [Bacteriovoracaceae bacterium]